MEKWGSAQKPRIRANFLSNQMGYCAGFILPILICFLFGQSPHLPKRKTTQSWRAPVTALLAAGYEVSAFFGYPVSLSGPWPKTVAFVIFAGALLKIIYRQQQELQSYHNPDFQFSLELRDKFQNDQNLQGIYWRVAVTNESPITAKQVRLILENWTFTAVGLNSDTKLAIKDETV